MLYNICILSRNYALLFIKYTYYNYVPYSIYGSNLTPVDK